MTETVTNWAGNLTFAPSRVHRPTSVAQVQQTVAASQRLRVLGTGHSFSPVADTGGDLLLTDRLPREVEVDPERGLARVSGGTRYAELAPAAHAAGLALPTMGSLPHISIAGAAATGTHGGGSTHRLLAVGVRELTMVGPDGDLVTCSRDDGPDFAGSVLALGRLGVVVETVLDLVPTYDVAQTVVQDVPADAIRHQLHAILASAHSVSVFTDFADHHQVWVKERLGRPDAWEDSSTWGGRLATTPQHPVSGQPAEAYAAVAALRDQLAPVLIVAELRAVAGDDLWLSPTGGLDCVAFHVTWRLEPEAVSPVVARIEEALSPLRARPHWGKVFTAGHDQLAPLYPRMPDMRRLIAAHDPDGVFASTIVDDWLGVP